MPDLRPAPVGRPLRVAVIGVGHLGRHHARLLAGMPDVELVAVARSTPASSVDKSETVDMKLREQWRPKPPQEQRILAAYASGKLKLSPPSNSPA